jgi:hypothetical protein
MKDIDQSSEANGVDGSIGISVFIVDHLQHTSAAETLQCLGARMLIAILRIVDGKTHDTANLVRKSPQVVSGRSDPYSGLLRRHAAPIPIALLL